MISTKNFAKSELSSGITSGATTLTVLSGHGSKFTIGDRCIIWDKSISDPADDTSHEIVEVTGVSTDTLTITRGLEGTTGVAHNTGGHTYGIIADVTSGVLSKIPSILTARTSVQFDVINSTTQTNVPGLSVNLKSGHVYRLNMLLSCTIDAGMGIFGFAGTSGLSSDSWVTSTFYDSFNGNFNVGVAMNISTLPTGGILAYVPTGGGLGTGHSFGVLVCTSDGTFTVQFSQDTLDASTSSVMIGSVLELIDIT